MLLILSFPKFGNGLVAWVALVPLLVSLHGATGWRAARLGYVTGAVSAVGLLYWTAFVVFQYGGGIPRVVAVLITLALCFAFAVFPLAFGWATGRLLAAFGTRGLLGAPVLWVAGADTKIPEALKLEPHSLAARRACFRNLVERIVPDAGHMLHHDQPERLAAVIEEFLAC